MTKKPKKLLLKEVIAQVEFAAIFRPELRNVVTDIHGNKYFKFEDLKRAMQSLLN